MEAIETFGLCKEYGKITAVRDLHLTVHSGELFSLLGVNGAGKTTTIRLLTGLTPPTAGDALLHGKSILRDAAAVKSLIGVSPQETAIAAGLTVRENLDLLCGVYAIPKRRRAAKIDAIAARLGLDGCMDRRAGKLSGGLQRRLSIAMALIGEPQILFLDEPTLGLDVLARSDLWNLIRTLKESVTVILTTHYMEEAEALSDRVGILQNGSLLACDTPAALLRQTGADRLEDAFIRIVKGAEQ